MRYQPHAVVAIGLLCTLSLATVNCRKKDAPKELDAPREGPIDRGGGELIFGELPSNCIVHAVGTYAGKTEVKDVELDRSGHRVMQADVVVNVPDRPVVLVLTAYDPTVWRVGRTAATQLVGVVVSGYHGQALTGIEKRTPHAVSSYENRNGAAFPHFYAYEASPQLLAMNRAVKRLVGREIDHFENAPIRGVFCVGDPPKDGQQVIHADELKVADFVPVPSIAAQGAAVPVLPAGQKGLDVLVNEGKLRLATADDIDAWVDKASEQYKRFNTASRVSTHMRVGRTYVVLKELTLPDGLFGAHLRHFIIPDGVPTPGGPKGHCNFYKMDGTQEGPFARAEKSQ